MRISDWSSDVCSSDLIRFQVRCNGESEPHIHAARVALNRGVQKFLDLGKINDLVEFPQDFLALHAKNRSVQENIFAAGKFGMKTGADFQEAGNAAVESNPTCARFRDEIGRASCRERVCPSV